MCNSLVSDDFFLSLKKKKKKAFHWSYSLEREDFGNERQLSIYTVIRHFGKSLILK